MAVIAAAVLVTGCAATPEQIAEQEAEQRVELAEALEGRTAGEPQNCISIDRVGAPNVVTDGTILYRENGNRTWLARTEGECPWLREDVVLITDVYGSQLCRNDRFRTIERGGSIPSAYCRFGSFTPYDKN